MKKILIALAMLAFGVSALPQTRAVDSAVSLPSHSLLFPSGEISPTIPLSVLRNPASSWFSLTTNGHE